MSDDEYFVDDNDDYESEYSDVEDLDLEDGEAGETVEGEEDKDVDDGEGDDEKDGDIEGDVADVVDGEVDVDDEDELKIEEVEEEEMIIIEDYKGDQKHRLTKRITQKFLTKYEKARILGCRAIQISKGAKPLIDIFSTQLTDPIEIAKKELYSKVIPLIIRRYLPDGRFEDWDVNELIIF